MPLPSIPSPAPSFMSNGSVLIPTLPSVVGNATISDYYAGDGLATFNSYQDGTHWLDNSSGEVLRKIRGQPMLEGGVLYHRPIGVSVTATGTTPVDAGTTAARGGLRPIIKANFFRNKNWTLYGRISLGVTFTDTATQYFRFEVLSNGAIIGALQITPNLVPGVAASISGRQVDILFDLAPTGAAWGDGSAVATRMHATSFFEGGAQSGTGNSLVGLGYLFEHETYPGNINFTTEQLLTARVAATGGQTVYVNSVRWWM